MTESSGPKRLNKVAAEFNNSVQTIVEFLHSKGIEIDNKPTSKVTEQAYEELLRKFQPDKLDKQKSSELNLTPNIHRDDRPSHAEVKAPKVEVVVAAPEIVAPVEVVVERKVAKAPKVEVAAPVVEEVIEEKPKPKAKKKEEPIAETPAPVDEKHTFKIVDKIDLDSLNKSGKKGKKAEAPVEEEKPKKKTKKAEEEITEPVVETKTAKKVKEKTKEEIHAEGQMQTAPVAEVPAEPVVPRHISAKIDEDDKKGLTIVGKIDLDQFKPKKKPEENTPGGAGGAAGAKRKRKRKRVGLDINKLQQEERAKRDSGPTSGTAPVGGTARPPINRPPGGPGGPGGNNNNNNNNNNRGPGGPNRGPRPSDKAPIDPNKIAEQVKNTLSKLTKKTAFQDRSRVKKRRKQENRQRLADETPGVDSHLIQVTEFVTANDLSSLMNVSVTAVITTCMNLGLMVSINQRLDAETITIVADEFGFDVEFKEVEMDEPNLEEPDHEDKMIARPPIVTIMGHVDHGKTSLIDYIRSANVVAGEAGGITQHIGAYEVTLANGKAITFLDTPGHEAFTAMRARGAKVTDIVIIVIAADDSVMPQTKEAISHSLAAGVPIVFAFNKIDKENADVERIKQQLAEMNMLVEEWGGKYQSQEISAKKGLNVELLLEKVLLEAEILDLKADPTKRAIGTVIEASLDKGKGIMASVLVEKGTLRVGDIILAGANFGKVKAMFNERGGKVQEAPPATPVQLLGFDGAPAAGDRVYVTENEQQAKEIANKRRQLIREQGIRTRKHITLDEIGRRLAIGNFKELNLIIKGDVDGSVEALSDSLLRLSTPEIQVNTIFKGVGQISESDVLLASASDAIIVGFQVRPSVSARKLAEQEQIDIRLYSIIYDAIEEIKTAMEGMLTPTQEEKIVSNVEIRDVFSITKAGNVAGCYVLDGKITRNSKVRLIRDGVVVYTGELDTLKRFKDDVKEVAASYECGLTLKNFNDIKIGDIIEAFESVEVARKL